MPDQHSRPVPPPSAFGILREYLASRAAVTDQDFEVIRAAVLFKRLAAGEILQRAGDVVQYFTFVAAGCLRSYVIDAQGKEHIVQFAPETWWLADATSLSGSTQSRYFVDAIEDSELLLIDSQSHQHLADTIEGFGAAFRRGLQRHIAAKNERLVSTLGGTAEERYLEFLRVYPSIAGRVPQFMLASYLGVTPETVSRIRKNLSRRKSP